jgi:hypothetical protein
MLKYSNYFIYNPYWWILLHTLEHKKKKEKWEMSSKNGQGMNLHYARMYSIHAIRELRFLWIHWLPSQATHTLLVFKSSPQTKVVSVSSVAVAPLETFPAFRLMCLLWRSWGRRGREACLWGITVFIPKSVCLEYKPNGVSLPRHIPKEKGDFVLPNKFGVCEGGMCVCVCLCDGLNVKCPPKRFMGCCLDPNNWWCYWEMIGL